MNRYAGSVKSPASWVCTAVVVCVSNERMSSADAFVDGLAVSGGRAMLDTVDPTLLRDWRLPRLDDVRDDAVSFDGVMFDGLVWGDVESDSFASMMLHPMLLHTDREWALLEEPAELRSYPQNAFMSGRVADFSWHGIPDRLSVFSGDAIHSVRARTGIELSEMVYRFSLSPLDTYFQDYGSIDGPIVIEGAQLDDLGIPEGERGLAYQLSSYELKNNERVAGWILWAIGVPGDGEIEWTWWRLAVCDFRQGRSLITEATVRPVKQLPQMPMPTTIRELNRTYHALCPAIPELYIVSHRTDGPRDNK